MGEHYDFSGWATKNDLRCSDGRTIRKDAFVENDGEIVPLVWQHFHDDPSNVLGHALLENRPDGVYTYCSFNDSELAKDAKRGVEHRDITHLSIYANQLKQTKDRDVLHGKIREVSLVLAGANPGAMIDHPILAHSGEESEDEAVIYTDAELDLSHDDIAEDDESESAEEDKENMSKEEMKHAEEESKETPKEDSKSGDDKTVQDVFNEFTEEQKNVVYFMIGEALKEAGVDVGEEAAQDAFDESEEDIMKHNVFDGDGMENTLSHEDMEKFEKAVIADCKKYGSFKESFLAHADDEEEYGITDIETLFPEDKEINNPPEFIKRDTGWVGGVMSGVTHRPFSRIRMTFADITEDDARARGYMKKHMKKEEFFGLMRRTVSPQTVYKKQKLDRDDIIDITDFDVVSWMKSEMRVMLDEEIARAILVGDGRTPGSEDKINEANVIPILNDVGDGTTNIFTLQVTTQVANGASDEVKAKAFIKDAIKARKDYKGSGSPTAYMTSDMLYSCLLLEDGINHFLYPSVDALKNALGVANIVEVPVFENVTTKDGADLAAIIVNLKDYTVGADKGGAVSMFDDFDIDYNQQKYLIETRISGALTVPYSAIVLGVKERNS